MLKVLQVLFLNNLYNQLQNKTWRKEKRQMKQRIQLFLEVCSYVSGLFYCQGLWWLTLGSVVQGGTWTKSSLAFFLGKVIIWEGGLLIFLMVNYDDTCPEKCQTASLLRKEARVFQQGVGCKQSSSLSTKQLPCQQCRSLQQRANNFLRTSCWRVMKGTRHREENLTATPNLGWNRQAAYPYLN